MTRERKINLLAVGTRRLPRVFLYTRHFIRSPLFRRAGIPLAISNRTDRGEWGTRECAFYYPLPFIRIFNVLHEMKYAELVERDSDM